MKKLVYLSIILTLAAACGQSYEETKRISRLERQRQLKADSAALKIAVMPTLDCLPLLVARPYNLFDSLGADVRLKFFSSQIDCDALWEQEDCPFLSLITIGIRTFSITPEFPTSFVALILFISPSPKTNC